MKNFEDNGNYFVELHEKNPSVIFIAVENTLEALQKSAARYVEKFPHLIKIGVTGSSGKTTTKEEIKFALSRFGKVYATGGNFNNQIGVPATLCNMDMDSTM